MNLSISNIRQLLGFDNRFSFEEKLLNGFSLTGSLIGISILPAAFLGIFGQLPFITISLLFSISCGCYYLNRFRRDFLKALYGFCGLFTFLLLFEWYTMGGVHGTASVGIIGCNVALLLLMPKNLIGKYIIAFSALLLTMLLTERFLPESIMGEPVNFDTRQAQLISIFVLSTFATYFFKKEEFRRKTELLLNNQIQRHLVSAIENSYLMASFDENRNMLYLSKSASQVLPFNTQTELTLFLHRLVNERIQSEADHVVKELQLTFNQQEKYLDTIFHQGQENQQRFYHLIIHDITDRKNHEITLQQALNHQAEMNELKTKFVTMVSHQFRTPLATIQSASELLEIEGGCHPLPKNSPKRYSQIYESVESLRQMMERMLDFGSLESANPTLKVTPCCLKALIEDQIKKHLNAFPEKRNVNFKAPQNDRKVNLDFYLFQHIVSNLICNALKYSNSENEVITISLTYQEDDFQLTIADQGIGIPADDLKNLFMPFFRATNTENHKGTGIGLSFVKQFVELHKGTIGVESVLGGGTTFKINIPYLSESEKSAPQK